MQRERLQLPTAAWPYWAAAVIAVHGAAALPDAGRLDGLGDIRVAALGALGAQRRASAADQTVLCEGDTRDYSTGRAAELQRVAPGSAICTPLGASLRSTSQLLRVVTHCCLGTVDVVVNLCRTTCCRRRAHDLALHGVAVHGYLHFCPRPRIHAGRGLTTVVGGLTDVQVELSWPQIVPEVYAPLFARSPPVRHVLFAETAESESRQQSAAQADRFCTHPAHHRPPGDPSERRLRATNVTRSDSRSTSFA